MRYRSELQPYVEISAATTQEARFAVDVGHGKTAVACINVTKNDSTATATFDFETATHAGSPHWASAGTAGVSAQTKGLFRADLGESSTTRLAGVVRWKATGLNAALGFDIVIFFAEA